jgi:hypothetical protein
MMWRELKKILGKVRVILHGGSEGGASYRPDLHYMRGPGPKWHAKYGSLHAQIPQTAVRSAPYIDQAAGRWPSE